MTDELESLRKDPKLAFHFSPLVKRALGFAVGLYLGGLIALLNLLHLIVDDEVPLYLRLFEHFFAGYDATQSSGPIIGFLWGAWDGLRHRLEHSSPEELHARTLVPAHSSPPGLRTGPRFLGSHLRLP